MTTAHSSVEWKTTKKNTSFRFDSFDRAERNKGLKVLTPEFYNSLGISSLLNHMIMDDRKHQYAFESTFQECLCRLHNHHDLLNSTEYSFQLYYHMT
ncbi:hypothetical protein MTR_2g105650 [Medicago truncatula]|uniref:Uncharacterized protein n=1 Tax=Medicago truncatula TaxID=3880 RepID=A0A072VNF6_MEDTR|nr:hypothetical protein MTR_2g105650 [Medicago truncatula]